MTARALAVAVAGVIAVSVAAAALLAAAAYALLGAASPAAVAAAGLAAGGGGGCPAPADAQVAGTRWSAAQVANAAVIVAAGQADGVPVYGQVIAVATAMQESDLVNLPYGDRDSLGLFQQRPSQGWGTPAQILDPAYAAGRFYAALLAVPGWQGLPLTVAAQDIQGSASPGAYAKWQAAAEALVASAGGAAQAQASPAAASQAAAACAPVAPQAPSSSVPAAGSGG